MDQRQKMLERGLGIPFVGMSRESRLNVMKCVSLGSVKGFPLAKEEGDEERRASQELARRGGASQTGTFPLITMVQADETFG